MIFQSSFHNVVYPTRNYQDGYVCIRIWFSKSWDIGDCQKCSGSFVERVKLSKYKFIHIISIGIKLSLSRGEFLSKLKSLPL